MTNITADQLIDILLQKPERMTAGILEQRSLWVKARDHFLTYNRRQMMTTGSALEKLRQSLLLEFDQAAKVDQEHPRSLKKAMLELKALGYSNSQVHQIAGDVKRFTLTYICDTPNELKTQVSEEFPVYLTTWNDDSFLGAALLLSNNDRQSGSLAFTPPEDCTIHNSAYTEKTIPLAEQYFRPFMNEKISRHPQYLEPESPIFAHTRTPS